MNRFLFFIVALVFICGKALQGQVYQPFINESFEGYIPGVANSSANPEWFTTCLSGNCYNDWKIDTSCNITGNKSMAVTSHLLTDCAYDDFDNTHPGNIILFSKKVQMNSRFKNVSVVFNWKAGGNSTDYGMVAFSVSGNYNQLSDWTDVTNTYDGTAYGKYYNRSTLQLTAANMKSIITGDSVRIGFRWITSQVSGVSNPGWIIDDVVLCAFGEINSSLGDSIVPGIMTRLTITGYTGTVIEWERYSGGQWIYLAGNTDSYSTPINLTDGANKFRVKIQNGLQTTYSEKIIYVGAGYGINDRNPAQKEISIYPNPGNGRFTVANPSEKKSIISIFNGEGKIILGFTLEQGETLKTLDMTSYPAGVYFYSVSNEQNVHKKTLIIQH